MRQGAKEVEADTRQLSPNRLGQMRTCLVAWIKSDKSGAGSFAMSSNPVRPSR